MQSKKNIIKWKFETKQITAKKYEFVKQIKHFDNKSKLEAKMWQK